MRGEDAAHERLAVVLDALVVGRIVDHDAEGFRDRTELGVAESVISSSRAVAEVKTRYWVDAMAGQAHES
ncbi:hypothetical protein [Bradyrhizobium elkanii]|uniref:hypothetical protein n=1 Tax=Bradyrhizobium elkanii TaxID=29448 RepID=UPI000417DC7F|nr:hypothetical protein [Bradyrhizobium elkanii]